MLHVGHAILRSIFIARLDMQIYIGTKWQITYTYVFVLLIEVIYGILSISSVF